MYINLHCEVIKKASTKPVSDHIQIGRLFTVGSKRQLEMHGGGENV